MFEKQRPSESPFARLGISPAHCTSRVESWTKHLISSRVRLRLDCFRRPFLQTSNSSSCEEISETRQKHLLYFLALHLLVLLGHNFPHFDVLKDSVTQFFVPAQTRLIRVVKAVQSAASIRCLRLRLRLRTASFF